MLGTLKESLDFFLMGTVSGKVVLATYLAGVFDLTFIIVSSGVLGSWILLLFLFGFPLVLLFPGG